MSATIQDYFSAEQVVSWAQKFVRHASQQTELFETDPSVLSFIRDCVQPLALDLNLNCRLDAMGNLIVTIGPENDQRPTMIMAYAMTHPASRMENPFVGEVLDQNGVAVLRGRGIAEQKGALTAALAAVAAANTARGLRQPIVFVVSTAGETGQHKAAMCVLDSLRAPPEMGIIAIGTSGAFSLGNKGRIDVLIEVDGVSCHSSTPWRGRDAIKESCNIVEKLGALDLSGRKHPALGIATLTPTSFRSYPEATHTVQNLVRLTFDRRLLPGDDPTSALEQIRNCCTDSNSSSVRVTQGAIQLPSEIDPNGRLVETIKRGCRHMGIAEPESFYSHGCLDAGFFQSKGCDCTMWGPGSMNMWHTNEESVAIDALIDGCNGYLGFLLAAQDC